jgi:Lactonase, 7-bladed beta-propeller
MRSRDCGAFGNRNVRSRNGRAAFGFVLLAGIVGCGEPQASGPAPSPQRLVFASTYDGVATLALDTRTGAVTTLSQVALPASLGARTLAKAPAGNAAYLGGCGGIGGLVSLRVDTATGALSPFGTVAAGTCVSRIVVHPSGGLLLALAANGDELRTYRLDPATGTPVEPAASSVALDAGAALALHPSGRVVYVAEPAGVLAFSVDTTSGGLTPVPGTPASFPSRDQFPTAGLVTADGSFLFVAAAGLTLTTVGVVWSYVLDPITGRPTALPEPLAGSGEFVLNDTATDRRGRFLYGSTTRPFDHTGVSMQGPGVVAGFEIGAAGMLGPVPGSPYVGGIAPKAVAVDPESGFVLVGNGFARDLRSGATGGSVTVYSADADTGRLSEVPGSPFFVAAATVNALAVAP